MGVAVGEEHLELEGVVRAFLVRRDARAAARSALDGGPVVPAFWKEMAELGWLGLHVPEGDGGSGYGMLEVAVVAEQLGRECTPGPFLPVVVTAGAVAAAGSAEQRRAFLPGLIGGDVIAGLGAGGTYGIDQDGLLSGAGIVMYGEVADVLALVVGEDIVIVGRGDDGVSVRPRGNLDPSQPCAEVRCEAVAVPSASILRGAAGHARLLLDVLAAAEAAGGLATCREMAVAYAKQRVAFGRPIGQFQAIKHYCANMLVDEQLAVSAVWGGARSIDREDERLLALAGKAARVVSLPAYVRSAQVNIQVHGGIGFTWEHDAHLFLRRAAALKAFVGPHDDAASEVARVGAKTDVGALEVDMPAEAEAYREEARRFRSEYWALPPAERVDFVVGSGYLFPHWPRPWGRGAGPVEQLIIEEELKDVPRRDHLGPANSTHFSSEVAAGTILVHGTQEQKERWLRPIMMGRLKTCHLLSEPGGGSDLAALTTKAVRADDGWVVTGQKVWTSGAQYADYGLAFVRTDPEAPKHQGITAMIVDMTSPGITIRPLRQITGDSDFNEVFLDEVFVPRDDVVGGVNRGWAVARTGLDVERVSLGGGSSSTWEPSVQRPDLEAEWNSDVLVGLGELTAAAFALRAMNLRIASRSLAGSRAGVEGNLTKLIVAGHAQRVADFDLRLLGRSGVFTDGDSATSSRRFLQARLMSIGGGTSEILRNVIGERILGLPRDPLPN